MLDGRQELPTGEAERPKQHPIICWNKDGIILERQLKGIPFTVANNDVSEFGGDSPESKKQF